MSTHHCHGLSCKNPCAPKFLMCPPCWAHVPKSLQAAVYAAFNPAQCRPGKDRPAPTPLWHLMADLAILASAAKRAPDDAANRAARDAKAHGMLTLILHYAVEEAPEGTPFQTTVNDLLAKGLAAIPNELDWLQATLRAAAKRICDGEF